MTAFRTGLVDKRLVHKQEEGNVFVCDLRRAIPALVTRACAEQQILPNLGPEAQGLFLRSYLPTNTLEGDFVYALCLAPHRLPTRVLSSEDGSSPFSPSERATLGRYYSDDGSGEWLKRKVELTELDDAVLQKIFQSKQMNLETEGLVALASLFESVPGLPREQVYHAGLQVTASHPYYFEHPNEHVPGMMVIEAARQFALACWHRFGEVPLQGYQFILNQLNAQFFDYVDLNYPATFKGEVRDLVQRPTGEWESATLEVTLHQREGVCAEVVLPATVVSRRSFQRLRSTHSRTNPQHRFQPIPTIHHRLSLWNTVTKKYHDARLVDLSLEGLGAEVSENFEDETAPSGWEAFLYFEDVGFIRVHSALVWKRHLRGVLQLGFRFTDVSTSDKAQLHTVIRQYCHIQRGRERL